MKKILFLVFVFIGIGLTACNVENKEKQPHLPNVPQPPFTEPVLFYKINLLFNDSNGENVFDKEIPNWNFRDVKIEYFMSENYESSILGTKCNSYSILDNEIANWDKNPISLNETHLLLTNVVTEKMGNNFIQSFKERLWVKYKIIFPDNDEFEIKITGKDLQHLNVKPDKIYVNNVEVYSFPEENNPNTIPSITIEKNIN